MWTVLRVPGSDSSSSYARRGAQRTLWPRHYTPEFGEAVADIVRQLPTPEDDAGEELSATVMARLQAAARSAHDDWSDAGMPEVLAYLHSAKHVRVPVGLSG